MDLRRAESVEQRVYDENQPQLPCASGRKARPDAGAGGGRTGAGGGGNFLRHDQPVCDPAAQCARSEVHRLEGMRTVPQRTLPGFRHSRSRALDGPRHQRPERRMRILPRAMQRSRGFGRRYLAALHVQARPGATGRAWPRRRPVPRRRCATNATRT